MKRTTELVVRSKNVKSRKLNKLIKYLIESFIVYNVQ